jgi:hypothetical protein
LKSNTCDVRDIILLVVGLSFILCFIGLHYSNKHSKTRLIGQLETTHTTRPFVS